MPSQLYFDLNLTLATLSPTEVIKDESCTWISACFLIVFYLKMKHAYLRKQRLTSGCRSR